MENLALHTIRERTEVDMVRALCPKCENGTLNYIPGQQLSGPVKKWINHICSNEACKSTVILDKFFPFLDEAKDKDLKCGEQSMEVLQVDRLGR